MAEKNDKISLRKLALYVTIIGGVISAGVFFDGRIDKKIEAHPSVIELKTNQGDIQRRLERIETKLDDALKQRRDSKPYP